MAFLCHLRFPELLVCLDWDELKVCTSVPGFCVGGQGSESGPRGRWGPSKTEELSILGGLC